VRTLFSLLLLATLLLATLSTTASAQTVERVEIIDFGLYNIGEKMKPTGAFGTAAGVVNGVSHIKLAEATTTVPANLGVHFGFRYKIIGSAKGTATLKIVTLIPEPGIRNPNTGRTSVRNEYVETRPIGSTQYAGYSFDNPWEVVPGTWTKEVWDGDRKLASQSFNVVKP
jgi:uncharacterized protein DUF3859